MKRLHLRRLVALPLSLVLLAAFTLPAIADSGLDPTFGVSGKVVTPFGDNVFEEARDVATQADGRIVAVGPANGFGIARYLPNGSLDPSFSEDGKLVAKPTATNPKATAVIIQQDGAIVIAGQTAATGPSDIALIRLQPNGAYDNSFGANGVVITNLGRDYDEVRDMALQSDGRVLIAGSARAGNDSVAVLARYNTDGSLDTSFAGSGIALTPVAPGGSAAWGLEILPDGKIMVVANSYGSMQTIYLLRYNPDGSLDNTFGDKGIARPDIGANGGSANDLALQPDGKILVAGRFAQTFSDKFGVARMNADGSIDRTFGENGVAFASMLNGVTQVAVDRAGGILVAGRYISLSPSRVEFGVARFWPSGSLDTSFGENGVARAVFGAYPVPWAMTLDTSGAILLAGATDSGYTSDFGLARFLAPSVKLVRLPMVMR